MSVRILSRALVEAGSTLRSRRIGAAAVLALTSWQRPSRAAPDTSQLTTARELFDQGRALLAQHDYAQACGKFQESHRLDPGGGTLLNLALCHELAGRTATAWSEFREGLRTARRDRRSDRERFAEEHIAALELRLSRLRIVVAPAARAPGLVVLRDDVALGQSAWNEAFAVDPGEHVVRANAPGKQAIAVRVQVPPDGSTVTVTLAPLRDSPSAASHSDDDSGARQRLYGGIISGAGLVTIAVGAFFGIRAISRNDEADRLCPDSSHCDPRGLSLNEDARTDATIATVCMATGAGVLGLGGYLFFSAPSSADRKPARAEQRLEAGFIGRF